MRDFVTEVVKCKSNMIYIELGQETLTKINQFVQQVIRVKESESHHLIDSGQEYKRFSTGLMGECAIEKFFGVDFIDWSIGNSNTYNIADLTALGVNVGIKTVEMGKFPIIHKIAHRPELICIKRNETTIILCGLATIDVLNDSQDDNLILSPNLRRRGTKTGFYGFDRLIKVESLDDVIRVVGIDK